MLRTRMKNKTDKQMASRKHRNRVINRVDNGVHPLHWATSPGPSPIGTDPINLLKWYKNGSGNTSVTVKQKFVQSL